MLLPFGTSAWECAHVARVPVLCPSQPLLLHSAPRTMVTLWKPLPGGWHFSEGFWLPCLSYFLRFANCTPPFLQDLAQMHTTFPAKSSQLPQVDRSHGFCWVDSVCTLFIYSLYRLYYVSSSVYLPHCQPHCELLENRGQFDALSQGWHLSCTF